MVLIIKKLVSKKKKRITEKVDKKTFDLDLSYVADDIIAMGYPSSSFEKLYRNSRQVVKQYLDKKHGNAYKLWNLCAEKQYELRKFDNRVCQDFQFYDHESPPWRLIIPCCKSIQEFLNSPLEQPLSDASTSTASTQETHDSYTKPSPKKVAVIHCKAGKGRTGVIISSFLIYDRRVKSSDEALNLYAHKRTKDLKGVTIPSQRRYVHYVGRWMELGGVEPNPRQVLALKKIRFPSPSTNMLLTFKLVNQDKEIIYESGEKIQSGDLKFIEFNCNVILKDDVKLIVSESGKKGKLFLLWFNIEFIENDYVAIPKCDIDKLHKDKRNLIFGSDMKLELFFEKPSH